MEDVCRLWNGEISGSGRGGGVRKDRKGLAFGDSAIHTLKFSHNRDGSQQRAKRLSFLQLRSRLFMVSLRLTQ